MLTPSRVRSRLLSICLVALLIQQAKVVDGDAYLNNPRGSNNKLNEQQNNRNNANRLFDSQNNGNAGYQVGDKCDGVCQDDNGNYNSSMPGAGEGIMHFYPESVLNVEWTHQHASGMDYNNPNVHSEVVIQYMCNDDILRPDSSGAAIEPMDRFQTGAHGFNTSDSLGIRDGKVTQTIPDDVNAYKDQKYGMHESYGYYQDCKARERNKGLWTADKGVNDNRGATATRQEPNGNNRYGFECPEERDYYPYWHPTPWRDIAVLTSDMNRCKYYRDMSENVRGRNYCVKPEANNQAACIDPPILSRWEFREPHDLPPPECLEMPYTRDNHHGNGADGFPISYNWTLPSAEDVFRNTPEEVNELKCVLRIRYNISSGEGYNSGWLGAGAMGREVEFADSRMNGQNSPVKNDPLEDWVGLGHNQSGPLRLALDTSQTGRVFQDRTHVFTIRRRPRELKGKKIYNLNVRGRRGNIVQVYPNVEYDFVPTQLEVFEGDYIHYQWTGSDANANNEGQGRAKTDRSNLLQYDAQDSNMPAKIFYYDEFGDPATHEKPLFVGRDGKPNRTLYALMAFLNQTDCDPCYFAKGPRCELIDNRQTNNGEAQNDRRNCAVLNRAPAYFDGGVHEVPKAGTYRIMSTRNNNFSNRSQKAIIRVQKRSVALIAVAATGGAIVGLVALVAGASLVAPRAVMALVGGGSPAGAAAAGVAGAAVGGAADGAGSARGAGFFSCRGIFAARCIRVGKEKKFSVYLVVFCIAISLAGFFRNSDSLTFSKSVFFSLAKGAGYLLDFAMTAILFPTMRNLVSWLRTTPVSDVIPLDDNHAVHILIAKIVAVGTAIHVLGHYFNMDWHNWSIPEAAFATLPGATGHLVLAAMLAMYATSMMRKGIKLFGEFTLGSFDSFWLTHKLYILVYALLAFHAESFYKWAFWPVVMFVIDKAIHYMRGQKECRLVAVRQEAKGTDVMSLEMKVFHTGRVRFHYRCGQYLMLQCPELGKEWHPFTITSAPEEEFVSVHIRCRGDWTKALQKKINPEGSELIRFHPAGAKDAGDAEDAQVSKGTVPQPCKIRVDGPYGSGSDRTDEYSTVMLVGTGIGVTPFASVMKSLKIRQKREGNSVRPTKVYFYWVCRDQREFDWFSWLIEELSHLGDRFELNTYLTGELNLDEMMKQHGNQPNGLQADEKKAILAGAKGNRSLVNRGRNKVGTDEAEMVEAVGADNETGTKWAGRKWAGRPDWRRIFKEQAAKHAGEEIGVFLCGPGAEELSAMCKKSTTADTAFVFHKEVF